MKPAGPQAVQLGTAVIIAAMAVLSSSGQLLKWSGTGGLFLYALLIGSVVFLDMRSDLLTSLWKNRKLVATLLAVFCVLMMIAFLILYPIAHSGRFGPGTDRDEALNLAVHVILKGQYPYYFKTRFGVPTTPMPGALLLALPFYLLGNAAYQNLFWLPAFAVFSWHFIFSARQAFLFMAVFVCANLSFLQDFVMGGDYSVNVIYVTMAVVFFEYRLRQARSLQSLLIPAAFLGIAIASRPIYFAVLPVLFFHGRKTAGAFKSLAGCALAILIAAVLILPFYLYDPSGFSPLHISNFATSAIPHASLLLPALALATTCLAIVLPLEKMAFLAFWRS